MAEQVAPPAPGVVHGFGGPGAAGLPHPLRGRNKHSSRQRRPPPGRGLPGPFFAALTPLSSKLSNSSLILRSRRPYFCAAHKAGGADLDLPLNGAPSVGVPASSSTFPWNSSSLEKVEAWDSELTLVRLLPTGKKRGSVSAVPDPGAAQWVSLSRLDLHRCPRESHEAGAPQHSV